MPPWKKTSRPKSPAILRPSQVRSLRMLGCKIPDYPQEGTPEWTTFEAEDAERKVRVNSELKLVTARLEARFGEQYLRARRRLRRRKNAGPTAGS